MDHAPRLPLASSMNRLAALMSVLSMSGVAAASGQQRPDFSGEWIRAADSAADGRATVAATGDAAFRVGNMGSGWGSPLTITQRSNQLIVEYAFFSAYDLQPRLRFTYALDGSESRNTVMIGHAPSVQRATVAWAGSTLVITTMHPVPASGDGTTAQAQVRQALTLEPPNALIVETTRVGILGGPTATTRTVYTKR